MYPYVIIHNKDTSYMTAVHPVSIDDTMQINNNEVDEDQEQTSLTNINNINTTETRSLCPQVVGCISILLSSYIIIMVYYTMINRVIKCSSRPCHIPVDGKVQCECKNEQLDLVMFTLIGLMLYIIMLLFKFNINNNECESISCYNNGYILNPVRTSLKCLIHTSIAVCYITVDQVYSISDRYKYDSYQINFIYSWIFIVLLYTPFHFVTWMVLMYKG